MLIALLNNGPNNIDIDPVGRYCEFDKSREAFCEIKNQYIPQRLTQDFDKMNRKSNWVFEVYDPTLKRTIVIVMKEVGRRYYNSEKTDFAKGSIVPIPMDGIDGEE